MSYIEFAARNSANSGKNTLYPLSCKRERAGVRVLMIMASPLTSILSPGGRGKLEVIFSRHYRRIES
jgi:hypothetical protein